VKVNERGYLWTKWTALTSWTGNWETTHRRGEWTVLIAGTLGVFYPLSAARRSSKLRDIVKRTFIFSLLMASLTFSSHAAEGFYIGTYTAPGKSQGIYQGELDESTGEIKLGSLAVESSNPSFLALHPSGRFVYAVNEIGKGTVSAFAVQADGSLREMNRQSSLGAGPTHLSLDHAGRNALAANYGTGEVAVLPVKDDGSLGEATGLLEPLGKGSKPANVHPRAHSVYVSGDDRFVYSCDAGIDRVFVNRLEAGKGAMEPADPPFVSSAPGAAPRHLAFGNGAKFVYVLLEAGNGIIVYARDADTGKLSEIQTISTLPADFHGKDATAEIEVHPNGQFLYCSNRGLNTIAGFAIDAASGKLTALGQTPTQGANPRFFTIDPSGKWLLAANQSANNIVVFRIDPESGALTPAGHSMECHQPVCVVFQHAQR